MIAYLSSEGKYTLFTVGDKVLRFRTSHNLIRYERVKEWDKGYIVVDATYHKAGTVEDYIDLIPILDNLRIEPERFLDGVNAVQIRYDPVPVCNASSRITMN